MARKKSKSNGDRRKRAGKFGQAAAQGGQAGVSGHLNLPENVKQFRPKVGEYDLDVIGHEVTDTNDLDVKDGLVKVGEWWPRKRYLIHYGLTEDDKPKVCPRSVGKPCKACQERKAQLANEEGDEELADKLKPKEMELWCIVDIENDPDEIQVFDYSRHKFGTLLEEEIKASKDEDDEFFYLLEHDEGGRTINTRFAKKSFRSKDSGSISFITASKINIEDRKEDYDEDWWEENIINLDKVLIIPSEQQMEAFISQTGYEEREEEEGEEDKKSKRSRKSKDDDEDEKGKKSSKRSSKKDDDDEDEKGKKSSKRSKKDDDDDEDKKSKSSRRSRKKDDDDDGEEKTKRSSRKNSKKSSKDECPIEDGEFGVDNDQFDECETCRFWTKCRAAKEEMEGDDD